MHICFSALVEDGVEYEYSRSSGLELAFHECNMTGSINNELLYIPLLHLS